MKKLNQNGLSIVEVLLLFVVVGLIGFTAWYVYNAQKHTTKTQNDTVQGSSDAQKSSQKTSTSATPIAQTSSNAQDASDVTTAAKYIYESVPVDPNTDRYAILRRQNYITDKMVEEHQAHADYDVITCSQMAATKYTYETPVITKDTATLIVNGVYDSGPNKIETSWIKFQGKWQLDNTKCNF